MTLISVLLGAAIATTAGAVVWWRRSGEPHPAGIDEAELRPEPVTVRILDDADELWMALEQAVAFEAEAARVARHRVTRYRRELKAIEAARLAADEAASADGVVPVAAVERKRRRRAA